MNANAPIYAFFTVAAIAIIDDVLYSNWIVFYYRKGFVLRRRFVQVKQPAIGSIENQLLSKELPLNFRRFGPDTIAYREKSLIGWLHKSPLIHGTILIEPDRKRVRVDMIANYFTVIFPVFFIGFCWMMMPLPMAIFFSIFGAFVFSVLFDMSKSAYDDLCRELENPVGSLENTKAVER